MTALMALFLVLTSIQNIEAQQDSISINITTSPALLKNRFVCPGMVVFTCKTRGSQTIAWSSEHYIGQGNSMLTFAHGVDAVNSTRMRLSGHTVAKLTQDYTESDQRVLVSTLQINTMVSISNLHNASVTCMDNHGRNRSIEFQVVGNFKFNFNYGTIILADPGKPEELFAFQVSHAATNNCIATAVWRHSINISGDEIQHYQIFTNAIDVSNDTIISGTSNDGLVMASVFFLSGCMEHMITIREVNICDRHGQESDPYILEQCPCDTPTSDAYGTNVTGNERNGGNRNGISPFVMALLLIILSGRPV